MAYAKALQILAGKGQTAYQRSSTPFSRSVVELREGMKCYISFTDKDIFGGMVLLQESPIIQPKEATPKGAQLAPANSPVKEATTDVTMEPTRGRSL